MWANGGFATTRYGVTGNGTSHTSARHTVTFDSGDNHWVYVFAGFYPVGGWSWAQVDAFDLTEEGFRLPAR